MPLKFINNKDYLLYLLILVTFIKELVFSALVPIFHTPDEQAHFAQTAFFAEFNHMPIYPKDTNREIVEAERLLGTERDIRGNNRFTFNPDYRIEYTDSVMGKYEEKINNFPKSYRQEMIRQEAANYPPLYYWITGFIIKMFYDTNLVDRIYLARFFSIVLSVGLVIFAYKLSKLIFPQNKIYQFSLASLVSFQPMLSFVGVGVTSDNLMNFLYSALLYICCLIIINKMTGKLIIWSAVILILLYLTKPQFILGIPTLIVAILISYLLNSKNRKRLILFLSGSIIFLGSLFAIYIIDKTILARVEKLFYNQSFFPGDVKTNSSLISFLKETLRHTVAEVMPWYWGVYNWLGVTYPRITHRIINRIIIIGIIGVIVKLILLLRKRNREDYLFLFFISASVIYFFGITFYNYLFYLGHGFAFGIQGRYYFPTIIAHMAILMIGFISLVPSRFKSIKEWLVKSLTFGMILLNVHALVLLAGSYYNLSSFQIFITQASQYKPLIFKGNFLSALLIIYSLLLLVYLYKLVTLKNDKIAA